MVIRRAQEKDIPDILELLVMVNMVHHNARPDLFNGPATKYDSRQLEEILRDDSRPVYVAVEEKEGREKVCGHCFCVYEKTEATPLRTAIKTLYIDDLSVHEDYRGQKIGTALYNYVKDIAVRENCYNITLHVWEGNDKARLFYDHLGMKTQFTCLETIL